MITRVGVGADNPHVITSVGNEGLSLLQLLKYSPSLSPARLLSFYGMSLFSYTILSSAVVCLAQWRFIHFHGQKTPRQDCCKSIYKDGHHGRTILIRFLSPILFFFPDVHLRELEKLWTDEIIVETLWRDFMQKLVSEWTDFVLYVWFPLNPGHTRFDSEFDSQQ